MIRIPIAIYIEACRRQHHAGSTTRSAMARQAAAQGAAIIRARHLPRRRHDRRIHRMDKIEQYAAEAGKHATIAAAIIADEALIMTRYEIAPQAARHAATVAQEAAKAGRLHADATTTAKIDELAGLATMAASKYPTTAIGWAASAAHLAAGALCAAGEQTAGSIFLCAADALSAVRSAFDIGRKIDQRRQEITELTADKGAAIWAAKNAAQKIAEAHAQQPAEEAAG